jgi:hypothetical protein
MAALPSVPIPDITTESISGAFAILTAGNTTVTASSVAGTTAQAGTTLSNRGPAVTLSDGIAISVGQNGLIDSTTTEEFTLSHFGNVCSGSLPPISCHKRDEARLYTDTEP